MRIKHAAWPTGAPPVTVHWDQYAWDQFGESFRPEGYTGHIYDMKAWSEFRYQRLLKQGDEFFAAHCCVGKITWKLWLDDDCNDYEKRDRWIPDLPGGYIGAETSEEAIELVQKYGFENLELIDLDHDLGLYPDGSERTAKTFVKWLQETYPDGPVPAFKVHSANPDGAGWLRSYLDSWKRSLE
jgi:hypothetical protein